MNGRLVSLIFGLLITAAFFMMIFCPPDEESVLRENRAMAEMPLPNAENIFSGQFSKQFESYLNDKIGFRTQLTAAAATVGNLRGVTTKQGRIISVNKDIGTGTSEKSSLLIYNDSIMEIFRENKKGRERYIQALDHYAEKMDSGVNMYAMVVPTQLEFQDPMYANIQNSQKQTIDAIYEKMNSRIHSVDAYTALAEHKNEYVYFRTDHHWTALGAYYAYLAYCRTVGLPPVERDAFEEKQTLGFLGTLYDQAQATELADKPDSIIWYDTDPDKQLKMEMKGMDGDELAVYNGELFDFGDKMIKYSFFMGGDHPYGEIINPNLEGGRTLLLLKDSYANAFVPWVINNYYQIIMIDPRSYWTDLSEVFKKYTPDDFLMLNYVFTTTFEDYCETMEDIYQ